MAKESSSATWLKRFLARSSLVIPALASVGLASAAEVTVGPRATLGGSDGCQNIRDAIAQASPSEPLVVRIAPGNYECREPIFIERSDVKLVGVKSPEGYRPNLRLADRANAPLIVAGSRSITFDEKARAAALAEADKSLAKDHAEAVKKYLSNPVVSLSAARYSNIEISGLEIDGNRKNQDRECWMGECDTPGKPETTIRNNGITLRGVSGVKISDVKITGARSGGVVTEKFCHHLKLDDVEVTDSHYDGFAFYETFESDIDRIDAHHNLYAGISLDINVSFNRFDKTRADKNGHSGIFARWSHDNTFVEPRFDGNGTDGGSPAVFLGSYRADHKVPESASIERGVSGTVLLRPTIVNTNGPGIRNNDLSNFRTKVVDPVFRDNRHPNVCTEPGMQVEVVAARTNSVHEDFKAQNTAIVLPKKPGILKDNKLGRPYLEYKTSGGGLLKIYLKDKTPRKLPEVVQPASATVTWNGLEEKVRSPEFDPSIRFWTGDDKNPVDSIHFLKPNVSGRIHMQDLKEALAELGGRLAPLDAKAKPSAIRFVEAEGTVDAGESARKPASEAREGARAN